MRAHERCALGVLIRMTRASLVLQRLYGAIMGVLPGGGGGGGLYLDGVLGFLFFGVVRVRAARTSFIVARHWVRR